MGRRRREVIHDFKLGESDEAAGAAGAAAASDEEVLEVEERPTLGADDLFTDESRNWEVIFSAFLRFLLCFSLFGWIRWMNTMCPSTIVTHD